MSARMELHVALSLRLDAVEAYRLANAYRAEVLREAAAELVAFCPDHGDRDTSFMNCHCPAADELHRKANAGKGTASSGETTQPAELAATLNVDRSESRCGHCGEPTLVTGVTHHNDISGWAPRPGGGCGARFTAIAAANSAITPEQLREMRPDLPAHDRPARHVECAHGRYAPHTCPACQIGTRA